ncbi:MAG TPA: ABC transporter ATP-binding protein [Actinomycetes bacterium]|nr:ABC transporter ATP-binding protein [Actinomycetes bacterium]
MTLVRVTEVTHRFGSLTAVDRVSLAVEPGEVVGLLGANGAGKTTLIRCILGLLRPTSGEVRLFGRAPSRETRARLGYVPQGLGLYDDLTVAENLAFSARAFGVAPAGRDRATAPPGSADTDLDRDVAAVAGELVGDLPLGLRRRVAFAAALAHRPDLLVLDEPTSGVDPLGRTHLWDTIRAAAEAGAGALVTTHYMSEAEQCDRLVVLAGGRVAAQGTMAAIMGDASTVRVATPRWEDAFVALEEAGLPVALVGRSLRVPGTDRERVAGALRASGVQAGLDLVPATFEETFVALAAGAAA